MLVLQGLPITRKTSFFYQCRTLARALVRRRDDEPERPTNRSGPRERNRTVRSERLRVFHAGPVAFDRPWEFDLYCVASESPKCESGELQSGTSAKPPDGPTITIDGFDNLLTETGATAVIVLGYPDQVPLLKKTEDGTTNFSPRVRLFWWAQLSKPLPPDTIADRVTAVPLTPATRRLLAASGVSRIGPVIPHGVDTGIFKPSGKPSGTPPSLSGAAIDHGSVYEEGGIDDGFVVGAVGANNRRKRYDDLFAAFSLFLRRIPEPRSPSGKTVEPRQAGPRQFGLRQAGPRLLVKTDKLVSDGGWDLPKLAEQYGLSERTVIIHGEQSPRRMAELYNQMDVFISVSEWEGFCIPVIEAMACGVPVICRKLQGPGEIVPYEELFLHSCRYGEEDTQNEFENEFIPSRVDPEEAGDLLYAVAVDRTVRERVAAKGLAAAQEKYSIYKTAEMWRDLFFNKCLS